MISKQSPKMAKSSETSTVVSQRLRLLESAPRAPTSGIPTTTHPLLGSSHPDLSNTQSLNRSTHSDDHSNSLSREYLWRALLIWTVAVRGVAEGGDVRAVALRWRIGERRVNEAIRRWSVTAK